MQSHLRQRNITLLYKPPPQQDNSHNYKKLAIAILISFVFIAAELYAGIYAHSIAIISDAIHLVSDSLSFFFSFLFLYLSKLPSNPKMSFGYHRMQLLGAIANIFIIWILILFVVYESTSRIVNREFVEQPLIMLITAVAGFFVNLAMYKILHHRGRHHGLMSNGCGHCHKKHHNGRHKHRGEHRYNRSLSYDKPKNKENKVIRITKSEIYPCQLNMTQDSCTENICKDEECNSSIRVIHCHKNDSIHRHETMSDSPIPHHNSKHNNTHCRSVNAVAKKPHTAHLKTQLQQKLIADNQLEQQCESSSSEEQNNQFDVSIQSIHGSSNKTRHNLYAGKMSNDPNNEKQGSRIESISMQAAVIHALSDMIMSIGLIISSLIIFFLGNPDKPYSQKVTEWNAWHLFDPIATYIFSILALASTVPVLKNSYLLIMETTPNYIDLAQLTKQCQAVEGVRDIHDMHVWDLKQGKTCMMAHVLARAGSERRVLVQLSDIAREHRIFHSNFQVQQQQWKDSSSYILCDHDIH